jgi:hypothetical protein
MTCSVKWRHEGPLQLWILLWVVDLQESSVVSSLTIELMTLIMQSDGLNQPAPRGYPWSKHYRSEEKTTFRN